MECHDKYVIICYKCKLLLFKKHISCVIDVIYKICTSFDEHNSCILRHVHVYMTSNEMDHFILLVTQFDY